MKRVEKDEWKEFAMDAVKLVGWFGVCGALMGVAIVGFLLGMLK